MERRLDWEYGQFRRWLDFASLALIHLPPVHHHWNHWGLRVRQWLLARRQFHLNVSGQGRRRRWTRTSRASNYPSLGEALDSAPPAEFFNLLAELGREDRDFYGAIYLHYARTRRDETSA